MILTHKVKAGAIALLEGARRLLNVSPDAPISGWTVTDGRLVREVSP